jgi:hypothetical protein
MLSQITHLAQKGLQTGFLKSLSTPSTTNDDSFPLTYNYGPLTSNLFVNFRHEWIKSFIRNNCGRYNFLLLDSIDQINPTSNMTIGWQTKLPNHLSQPPPLILKHKNEIEDDYLCIRYIKPIDDINLIRLSDERTRFWKKYFSRREKLECISSKQNQFNINYRFSSEIEPYHLETIQTNQNSSYDLLLNINHTLISLLIDSQMKYLHPLLSAHQIGIKPTLKTIELSFYLSKLLTYKYDLRILRLINNEDIDYIPFHIILNDNSIKNGLCSVWNRDTQLNEEIHVKQVAKRLADHFKALEDFL